MKKIILYLFLLTWSYQSVADSISGPTTVCPGQAVRYVWNPSFDIANCGVSPLWQLKQNGVTILSYTNPTEIENDWSFTWPSNTIPGNATIEVNGGPTCCLLGFCDPEDFFNVTVGLGAPSNILGPENICPNSTETFNLAALAFATTYTWTVPSGWKVNGIAGPVVTGQGNSVQITAQTTGAGNYSIKVKGVSSSCGTSPQVIRQQKLDYPIELSAGPPNDYAEFTAMPANQNSYTWILPTTWRKIYQQYNEIFCDTRGNAGTIVVQVQTLCNNTVAAQAYFDPNGSFSVLAAGASIYPNPVMDNLTISNAEKNSWLFFIDSDGEVVKEVKVDEGNKTISVKDLPPGNYFVRHRHDNKEEVTRIKKE